jgi:hypothetical protein
MMTHAMQVHIDLASVYGMCHIGMRHTWKEKLGQVKYDILKELHVITRSVGSANSTKRARSIQGYSEANRECSSVFGPMQ